MTNQEKIDGNNKVIADCWAKVEEIVTKREQAIEEWGVDRFTSVIDNLIRDIKFLNNINSNIEVSENMNKTSATNN